MIASDVSALSVVGLSKSYNHKAAATSISFTVHAGEVVGLLGPNGAGKTTVIESIAGLIRPDAGRVEVCGIDAQQHPATAKQKIGAVLQFTALQDKITPAEAIQVFGSLYPETIPVETLLRRFGLEEFSNQSFSTLSGGQQQRVALALAFVGNPKLLLLDEPTVGLDPLMRHEVHNLIRTAKEEGRSILMTTHDMEEAELLCDRILIIDHGRLLAEGTPLQLIADASSTMRVSVQTEPAFQVDWLNGIEDISTEAQGASFSITHTNIKSVLAQLLAALEQHDAELMNLHVFKATLEDVIWKLAGSKVS